MMHLLYIEHGPSCLIELMQATAELSGRSRLRSSRTPKDELPQLNLTIGQRTFSYAVPTAWNCLPQSLVNTGTFKRHVKAHFFARVFAS